MKSRGRAPPRQGQTRGDRTAGPPSTSPVASRRLPPYSVSRRLVSAVEPHMLRCLGACLLLPALAVAADVPKMKFNEVKEIAPGVFFRYSAISPTDPSVFGGSNHLWVVFEDYVVVIDANFPKEAGDVIEAIKKT